MRIRLRQRGEKGRPAGSVVALALLAFAFMGASPANAEAYIVDPGRGDSTMTAVYDFAPTGDRIEAHSTHVYCDLDFSPEGIASGKCRIPLMSIVVSEEPTRTRHFQDWTTHKAQDPETCAFELSFENARVSKAVRDAAPLPFEVEGQFKVCGRERDDKGKEKIQGIVTILPGEGGRGRTVQIRAKIQGFDRERYEIGPKFAPGWLARIPKIEQVVAPTGDIEVNLLAVPKR